MKEADIYGIVQISFCKGHKLGNSDMMYDDIKRVTPFESHRTPRMMSPYEIITSSNFRSAQFARVYCNLHKLH